MRAQASMEIAASGTITQLVPPSLVLVVLADQLGRSVGDMYLGAIGPSILQTAIFLLFTLGVALLRPQWVPPLPEEARTVRGWPLVKRVMWGMLPSIVLIFLVLGTLFSFWGVLASAPLLAIIYTYRTRRQQPEVLPPDPRPQLRR